MLNEYVAADDNLITSAEFEWADGVNSNPRRLPKFPPKGWSWIFSTPGQIDFGGDNFLHRIGFELDKPPTAN